ncbi:polysaccharide deacetylase family protein [Brevibacillus choshinensis]|uniref:polysaccharide deacetylase family protein n=1 Tax=Brevibacillus choshinensis TaxID=54911 RepID=UPI002E1CF636|nr:polysaccharide deacetylase family protein [Brevibacillus choshinensis]MED4751140.1 polysaccharide deacetylase family protein [Brevibacillus choshinensis]MED4783270.1 polysaccharide deacetylase family protein [Brevibacillus choshinensis]
MERSNPISRRPKAVALTFDDGPDHIWTPRILDVLADYRIHATFMCVGKAVQRNPQMLRRIMDEGHIIGNHTWDHPNLTQLPLSDVETQVLRTTEEIDRVAGVKTRLFRPPYGDLNDDVVSKVTSLDHEILLWDIDSWDWKGLTGPQVAKNILGHVRDGSIVLQHCAGPTETVKGTLEALPFIIEVLSESGFTFSTIPQLLHLSAYR